MKHPWLSFLKEQQAHFQDNKLVHFGHLAAEQAAIGQQTVLSSLTHLSLIEVSGDDAKAFLHGQFSNSLDDINDNQSQLSSYSTAQGRLLAIFRLFQRNGKFYLILPQSISANIVKRLNMYKLRAKVQIIDISEQLGILGIAGLDAADHVKQLFPDIPQAVDEVIQTESATLLQTPSLAPRFEIIADYQQLQALWEKLKTNTIAVGEDTWERLNIQAGIPTIYPETSEKFVAQHVNLDQLNAINFKKGCYPGQEIIARMQYLGKNKKRMIHIQFESETIPLRGTELSKVASDSKESTGTLVDARYVATNYYEGLITTSTT